MADMGFFYFCSKTRYGKIRTLVVDLEESGKALGISGGEIYKEEGNRKWIRFNPDHITASELISQISLSHNIKDLTVEEPEIEGIISRIYQEGMTTTDHAPIHV